VDTPRPLGYAAWDIGAINVENIGDPPSSDPGAQRFYAEATGALVPFTEHLEEWFSASDTSAKTQKARRTVVMRFAREFETVQDVTRSEVRRWVTKLMKVDGLSSPTVQHILGGLRSYWRYLQSIEVAGEDHEPFTKLDVARQAKQTSSQSTRQTFEPSDVVKLLDAAIEKGDDQLADLIRLAMWTGCRIEELCSLNVQQVKGDHFVRGGQDQGRTAYRADTFGTATDHGPVGRPVGGRLRAIGAHGRQVWQSIEQHRQALRQAENVLGLRATAGLSFDPQDGRDDPGERRST